MKPFKPHNLPWKSFDWSKYISLIAEANRELARYDGLLQSIPNTEVILSPLTTQEAVLSSKIEGTQSSLEEVLEFEAKKNIILAKEILTLYDKLKLEIMESTGSKYTIKILDFLFTKPVFTTNDFVLHTNIPRRVANRHLKNISDDDIVILKEESSGNKPIVFSFNRLLEITSLPY